MKPLPPENIHKSVISYLIMSSHVSSYKINLKKLLHHTTHKIGQLKETIRNYKPKKKGMINISPPEPCNSAPVRLRNPRHHLHPGEGIPTFISLASGL